MGLSLIFCAGSQAEDTKGMLEALEAADYQALNQRMARKQIFLCTCSPEIYRLCQNVRPPFLLGKRPHSVRV